VKEEVVNVGDPNGSHRKEYPLTSLNSEEVVKVVRKSDEA
jgi:hypothetical protein